MIITEDTYFVTISKYQMEYHCLVPNTHHTILLFSFQKTYAKHIYKFGNEYEYEDQKSHYGTYAINTYASTKMDFQRAEQIINRKLKLEL